MQALQGGLKNSCMAVFIKMKKTLCSAVSIIACSLFIGCASFSGQSTAAYKKDVYPFILEQMNNTASVFFYDVERANRMIEGSGLPSLNYPPKNVMAGESETGGICTDYALHFIDNYTGPGNVYLVTTSGRNANLQRRIKPFDKSDIIITNVENYREETAETIEKLINDIYNIIIQDLEKSEGFYSGIINYETTNGLRMEPVTLQANGEGKLFLVEETLIPTPKPHAGRTRGYFNHAWVRIIWNGITIDIDPTWYDAGLSKRQSIKIIR